ncbi:hypothetical protein BHM03_00036704 [Ensete ventricosum]|nr:hypothetical protein BHM03_00036704 [Ensete ventricosum]
MACFCLSLGQAVCYLTTRTGFRVGGAPSSNKGWKSRFFFISCRQGRSFPTEWTSRTVNNSVPVLSANETELVEILRGILSTSRGVKDMNEAWLAKAGLSPTPGPRTGYGCFGEHHKAPVEKGKEPMEIEEAPELGYLIWDLCEVDDRAGADKYFASIMTRLKTAEGEDPLVPRWSAISGSTKVWTKLGC